MNYDDQPVGQHKNMEMSELPPESQPQDVAAPAEKIGSLAERLLSKNSKTRFEAIADLLKIFSEAKAGDAVFAEHYPQFPKYISDTHPGAQEKALEAFLLLLTKSPPQVDKTLSDSLSAIVEKGLSSPKSTVKSKATECLLSIYEMEQTQAATAEVLKNFITSKTSPPKTVSAALQASIQLLSAFGDPAFPCKEFLGLAALQAASTNAGVRTEALGYMREAHRWLKEGVMSAVESLRQAQKEELKKQFAEEGDKSAPVPSRRIKGKAISVASVEKKEKNVDTYSSAVEVSMLKKFGETWCGKVLGSKKWSEKRDMLEELIKAISVEKIKNENCNELCQTLKKLLNDPNIVVVNQSLKAIAGLALGLRGHLATYSKHIFEPVMQKCKDKKSVVEAQKCLENLAHSLKLEDMMEIFKETLSDKSPLVRAKLCAWLETTVLPRIAPALAETMAAVLTPILIKLTDDASSDVRDAALGCLGGFKAILKDEELEKTIGEMSSQKQEKIAKAVEQMAKACGRKDAEEETKGEQPSEDKKEEKADGPAEVAEDAKEDSKGEEPESKNEESEPVPEIKKEEEKTTTLIAVEVEGEKGKVKADDVVIPSATDANSAPPTPAAADAPEDKKEEPPAVPENPPPSEVPSKKPNLANRPPPLKARAKTAAAPKASSSKEEHTKEIAEEDVGAIVSPEEAAKQVAEILPKTAIAQLDLPEWKERLKGLQELNAWISSTPDQAGNLVEPLTVWLKKQTTDFKEGNHNLMKETLAILNTLASTFPVSKKFAHETLPALVDKLNDLKSAESSMHIILEIADSATPTYVGTMIIKSAYGAKSPNLLKGVLSLLGKMLEGYGASLVPIKLTVDFAKHCLGQSNPQVRTAATGYIGLAYQYVGETVKTWVTADLKESVCKTVESELAKLQPKLMKDATETKRKLRGESEIDAGKRKKGKDLADSLIPRANVSSQITSKLVASLSDPSMKHRQEAKDSIDKLLATANYRILPAGINPLMSALKARMGEPCKNLAKGFITLVGGLALAMGQGFKQYSKIIVQPLMYNLADKQTSIRSETVVSMDKIAEAAGPELILNNVAPLLEKDNPDMRSELLGWILKNKDHLSKVDTGSLVTSLIASMQDRSKEIRGLAEQVVAEVMPHAGFTAFSNAIQDLKPVVKLTLKAVLEKYKAPELSHTPNKPSSETLVSAIPEERKVEEIKKEPDAVVTEVKAESVVECKEKLPASPTKKPPIDPGSNCPKSSDKAAGKQKAKGKEEKKHKRQEMIASRSTNNLVEEPDMTRADANKSTISVVQKESARVVPKFSSKGSKKNFASPSKSQLSGDSSNNGLIVETIVLSAPGNKDKRAEADKNTKWPVNEIREDYVEKLKKGLRAALHPNLFDYMFATQFKKNLAAIHVLTEGINSEFPSLVDILDLLFKWVVTKMVDQSNTAINKAILEFLISMFKKLTETKYQMLDFEAAVIVPMLCERTGISNSGFRQQIKELLKSACQIQTVGKVTGYLMSALESKNQKTKVECLGLLREFAGKHGAKIFATRDSKVFGKLVQSSDTAIKSEALEILSEIYVFRGESLWTSIGELPEKTRELLKKRFIPGSTTPHSKENGAKHFAGSKGHSPLKRTVTPNKDFSTAITHVLSATSVREDKKPEEEKLVEKGKDNGSLLDSSALVGSGKHAEDVPVDEENKEEEDPEEDTEMQFNATDTVKGMLESTQGNLLLPKLPTSPSEEERRHIQESARKSPAHSSTVPRQDGEAVQTAGKKIGEARVETKIESLEQCLETLRSGDISHRVDALMFLNEKATSAPEKEREGLNTSCDVLFDTFSEVLKDIFDKATHDIPIRFAKYFMTVTNKICSSKPILRGASEKPMRDFAEQLLTKLLYDGLEKMGENSEGEYMIKALNSTMLRILENCNPTRSLLILIELFKSYKNAPAMTGKIKTAKLPGLIVKCILKLTKVIDSLISGLDVGRLLLCLHEYLSANPSTALPKTANDDIGTRIVKTIINELVKARGESIWEDYRIVEASPKPDTSIKRWIGIILKSTHVSADVHTAGTGPVASESETGTTASSDELKEIFKGLNSQATFHEAIKSLSEYMGKHPSLELGQYFASCSKGFREYVMASLQKYVTKPAEIKGAGTKIPIEEIASSRNLGASPGACKKAMTQGFAVTPTGASSSAEYRAKMAILRQKFGMAGKDDSSTKMHDRLTPNYATQQKSAFTPASPDSLAKPASKKLD